MLIRNSTPEDLPEIQKIYAYAREFMRASGNPTQWGNTSPELSLILGDFENKTGYVIEQDGEIAGECNLGDYVSGNTERHEKLRDFLGKMGW